MRTFVIALLVLIGVMLLLLPVAAQDSPQFVHPDSLDSSAIIMSIQEEDHQDSVEYITEVFGQQTGLVDEALEELGFMDSAKAVLRFINFLYILLVIVTYYIIVVRVPFIPTNSFGKRNAVVFTLTVLYGVLCYFWQQIPIMNLLISGLSVNFCYEFLAKFLFRGMEKLGWIPLPQWYVDEVKAEKQKDVEHVENAKIQPTNDPRI